MLKVTLHNFDRDRTGNLVAGQVLAQAYIPNVHITSDTIAKLKDQLRCIPIPLPGIIIHNDNDTILSVEIGGTFLCYQFFFGVNK